jgi:formylglycine-generating enzyme required for sulfatase activity
MAGNVWEWVGEPYDDLAEGTRIVRGGRYGFIRDAAFRQPAQSDNERFVPFAGFRCVADQVQGE